MNGSEGDLTWSPDGKYLSFTSRLTRTSSNRLYLIEASGGQPVNLLGNWQYEPQDHWWTPDGQILLSAAVGGRTALFRLAPATKELREVIGGRRRINGFSSDEKNTKIAFVATSVSSPTELYVANADGSGETRLTGFNDKLNAEIEWPEAERFTYKSVGGLEIEGTIPTMRCVMVTHGFADLPKDTVILRAIVRDANQNVGLYANPTGAARVRVGDEVLLAD